MASCGICGHAGVHAVVMGSVWPKRCDQCAACAKLEEAETSRDAAPEDP